MAQAAPRRLATLDRLGEAQTPPAGSSCPICGAPVDRAQLVCLNCGGRVGLRYKRPPRWQLPVVLAVAVVALAVAALFFALQAASDDAQSEVARGPASRQEAREADRPQRSPQSEPEKPAQDPALATAKQGPVAVLSGVPEPGAAAGYAHGLERQGFKLGEVTNAPGGVGSFAVQYADGSEDAARALAKEEGIADVKAIEPEVAARASDAKLVVIVGARK